MIFNAIAMIYVFYQMPASINIRQRVLNNLRYFSTTTLKYSHDNSILLMDIGTCTCARNPTVD